MERVLVAMQTEAKGSQKRMQLSLGEATFNKINELAAHSRTSLSDVVSLGLSLAMIIIEEGRRGNKFFVAGPDGKLLKEVVTSISWPKVGQ